MTTSLSATPEPVDSPPGQISPTETVRFPSRDGTALYGEYFAAENPRAVALIMHGYAEHCGRYREVAHVLVNAGLSALSYDMRGHGRSEGQRGHIMQFADYFDDMNSALEKLDDLTGGGLDRVLVCHSNGSFIALRALADPAQCPDRVVCAVVSSPFLGMAMKVNPVTSVFGKLASRVLPTLSMPNGLKIEDLTHDPGKLDERRIDTLCHDVTSTRWYSETVREHEWVHNFIGKLKTPTLWLVAGGDRIVDRHASRRVHSRIRAPSVYREFPQMHHEVFNEIDRADAFAMIAEFLDERLPEKS